MLSHGRASFMLSSPPAFALLLKLTLTHPYVLSASASGEGNPRVESTADRSADASPTVRWHRSSRKPFRRTKKRFLTSVC